MHTLLKDIVIYLHLNSWGSSTTDTSHETYTLNGSRYSTPFFFSPMTDINISTQGGLDITCDVKFENCIVYKFKSDGSIQTFKSGDSDRVFSLSTNASYPYGENSYGYID